MSTQQAVTRAAKAVPNAVGLALALWAWLLAAAAAAVLAGFWGAAQGRLATAAALAMAPALAGFVLLPLLGRRRVGAGFLLVWLVSAAGLVAGSGGAGSPLVVLFAIPPAMALAIGRPWARLAGAVCVLAYAGAAALSCSPAASGASLSPFPEMMAAVALAFTAAILAIGQAGGSLPGKHAADDQIAEVSHELRTPLTHILGFAEMIERRIFGDLNERYVEYAGLIRKSGAHLLGLVNDLLDISRVEAGRYNLDHETFDARAIVEEVVRMSADAAERKQIKLAMVTPETPLMVSADVRALRRMLINTLGNALKFTPDGGRVIVSAAAADGVLILETIDNGPGIPEAERPGLGVAYERGAGAARAEGTGLGLALVRALAGLHGGALSLHEAPGGGALVRIALPALLSAAKRSN